MSEEEKKEEEEKNLAEEFEEPVRELSQFPCEIKKISTLVDGGLSINLHAPEMDGGDMTRIFNLRQKSAYALLKPTRIQEEELAKIPDEANVETFGKTKSERLRNVIFVYYAKKGKPGDFDNFYNRQMEGFISRYKKKINEIENE